MDGDQNNPAGTGGGNGGGNGGGGAAPAAPTRCEQGPADTIPYPPTISVALGAQVSFRMVLCLSPFRVTVNLDGQTVYDQNPVPGDEVSVPLALNLQGSHHLVWSYLASGPNFKTLTEISVNGAVQYRRRTAAPQNPPFDFFIVDFKVT